MWHVCEDAFSPAGVMTRARLPHRPTDELRDWDMRNDDRVLYEVAHLSAVTVYTTRLDWRGETRRVGRLLWPSNKDAGARKAG